MRQRLTTLLLTSMLTLAAGNVDCPMMANAADDAQAPAAAPEAQTPSITTPPAWREHVNLGRAATAAREFTKAEKEYKLAVEDATKSGDKEAMRDANKALSDFYYTLGHTREALPPADTFLQLAEELYKPDSPKLAMAYNDVASGYQSAADYKKATELYAKALKIDEADTDKNAGDLCLIYYNLGNLNETTGDYAAANTYYQKELDLGTQAFGPKSEQAIQGLESLGVVATDQEQYGNAEDIYKRVAAIRDEIGQGDSDAMASTLISMGSNEVYLRDYENAEKSLTRALRIFEDHDGLVSLPVADTLIQLGNLHSFQHDYAKAEKDYRRCYDIRMKLLGKDHFHTALAASNIGYVLTILKRYKEAEEMFKLAIAAIDTSLGPDPQNLNAESVFNSYAKLLTILNRPEEADAMYARGAKVRGHTAPSLQGHTNGEIW